MLEYLFNGNGKISLKQFENLFSFQVHTGFYGLLFSIAWSVYVSRRHPAFWTNQWAQFWAAFVILGFGLILFLAFKYQRNISRRTIAFRAFFDLFRAQPVPVVEWTDQQWLYFARTRMALIVTLFIISCAALIWLTGGLQSPFVPVYVMVFTLTFGYTDVPHPGTLLTVLFFTCFLLASLFSEGWWVFDWSPPVDPKVYTQIHGDFYKKIGDVVAGLAAITIPYFAYAYAKATNQSKNTAARQPESTTIPN